MLPRRLDATCLVQTGQPVLVRAVIDAAGAIALHIRMPRIGHGPAPSRPILPRISFDPATHRMCRRLLRRRFRSRRWWFRTVLEWVVGWRPLLGKVAAILATSNRPASMVVWFIFVMLDRVVSDSIRFAFVKRAFYRGCKTGCLTVRKGNGCLFMRVSASEIWCLAPSAGAIGRADCFATERNSKNQANRGAVSS